MICLHSQEESKVDMLTCRQPTAAIHDEMHKMLAQMISETTAGLVLEFAERTSLVSAMVFHHMLHKPA